ncbi:MAG: DUF1854 domain-containing protein [Clostridiales bacterium]|jgi:hypothetical protein|nr:DUF1854 domain-containing protein [Clostridiales bacterium]
MHRERRKVEIEDIDMAKMEEQSADLLELRYLDKDNARFQRTEGGFVSLEYAGQYYERVGVYRTFPFTDPDHYISIREADEKAREIGVIKDLKSDVTKEEMEMLLEQLEIRYFTPIIKKIYNVKEEYGYAYFDVKTDYGRCKFTIHMGGGSVVHLSEERILITDLDGNRYEIPELSKLTALELKKLDLFI